MSEKEKLIENIEKTDLLAIEFIDNKRGFFKKKSFKE